MEPTFETLQAKFMIGKRLRMSFTENRTKELWQSFMPCRHTIRNTLNPDLYSIEVYNDPLFFDHFDPATEFEKWAALEAADTVDVPDQMEALVLPAGLYAVFIHKGPTSEGKATYEYIFRNWLPRSGFIVDDRPHFARMGILYKKDAPDSEEEIWIPLKPK